MKRFAGNESNDEGDAACQSMDTVSAAALAANHRGAIAGRGMCRDSQMDITDATIQVL